MRIVLRRLTNDSHRLTIEREDGSRESVELETRSLLLHDLVHYAVEAEAGIAHGFWGLLASGTTLGAFADRTMTNPIHPDIVTAEALVGPMQSVWNGRLSADRYVELASARAPGGDSPVIDIDAAFVERVRARLRSLFGRWRATAFHEDMVLTWPPA